MTRKLWQENAYRKAHEFLQKILIQAIDGITKTQIREKTRLSRPTIDRHLKDLIAEQKVERWGQLFFWGTNYFLQLERYRLILDIIYAQEKMDIAFKAKIAQAENTLRGRALNKKLDQIYLDELKWRAQILEKMKMRNVPGAEEKEVILKDGIKALRQLGDAAPDKRLEILKKHLKTSQQSSQG